jgi:hypothetical protein
MNRWVHTGLAFGVGLAVSLSCLAVGSLVIGTFASHAVQWVGLFLGAYAWVIGIVGGLWYLLAGPTAQADEDGGHSR